MNRPLALLDTETMKKIPDSCLDSSRGRVTPQGERSMKRRIGAWVLLYALLTGLSGTMLSCKSSAKPPAGSSPSAKVQDQSALTIVNGDKVTMDYSIILPDKTVAASSIG